MYKKYIPNYKRPQEKIEIHYNITHTIKEWNLGIKNILPLTRLLPTKKRSVQGFCKN